MSQPSTHDSVPCEPRRAVFQCYADPKLGCQLACGALMASVDDE